MPSSGEDAVKAGGILGKGQDVPPQHCGNYIDANACAVNVQVPSDSSIPFARPNPLLYSEQKPTQHCQVKPSYVHSPIGVIKRSDESLAFTEADEQSGASGPPNVSTRRRGLGPLSSCGTSDSPTEKARGSTWSVPNLPVTDGSHASSVAHHRHASPAGLDSFANSLSTELQRTADSRPAPIGEDGVLHSRDRVHPVHPSVRRTLKHVSRKNIIFAAALVLVILILTAAGGISVAFVNEHYNALSYLEHSQDKSRALLNRSIVRLHDYKEELQAGVADLMKFARYSMSLGDYESVATLRDALKDSFFRNWEMRLLSLNISSTHSIIVPFCEEPEINSGSCPIMVLKITCLPYTNPPQCIFESSNDDGLQTSRYEITFQNSVPHISTFREHGESTVGYLPMQANGDYAYYLSLIHTSFGPESLQPLLTVQLQESVAFSSGVKRNVISNLGSFLGQWFYRFESSLQKSPESYSMLFSGDGTILAYGQDYSKPLSDYDTEPCRCYSIKDSPVRCGVSESAILDEMANLFEASSSGAYMPGENTLSNSGFSMTKQMGKYSVSYQDFLSFSSGTGMNCLSLFAAYATPIDSQLGHDTILQIVICVVIIFLCMFILGGVALVAMTQMMKVVEVISQLATHAATYDTKQMRAVLDRQNPGYLARTLTSTEIINYEFQRILANLNAYRPFLPQSLLTKGNFDFSDGEMERPTLAERGGVFTGNSHDIFDAEYSCLEGVQGNGLLPAIAGNELRHVLSNPVENRRLLQRGFYRTKSTILVAVLSNVAVNGVDSVDQINKFVETVLDHAAYANGVVEAIEYQKVVVSFNSHFPVPRHQEKACLCALAMRDSFQNTGCSVTIGISSGYNYVGTTGTEQQKARVIVGESVGVAHALATLQYYLGCSIFASEAVVHEALVTAVVVDVVQLYYEHSHEWKQYNVSEIVGSCAVPLSEDMLLVKSVFKLVRCRQAEAALVAVRAYVKESEEKNRPLPWSVQHLHALVELQQQLIKSGYHRRRRHWQCLESEEVILNHLADINKLSTKQQRQHRSQLRRLPSNGVLGSVGGASVTEAVTLADLTAKTSDGFNRPEETRIALALMGEQSKVNASRRLVVPAQDVARGEEDTMFAIFVTGNDGDDQSDCDVAAEDECHASPLNTVAVDMNRAERSCGVAMAIPLPPPLSCLSSNALAASSVGPSYSSPPAPASAMVERQLSSSGRASTYSVRARNTPLLHPRVKGAQSPNSGPQSIAGAVNSTNSNSNCCGGGNDRMMSSIEEGHLGLSDIACGGSVEGASGSLSVRQHNGFELPERIVSVEGQVFYRTSHQIGRGSFGAVYLVISETGFLGAMKTFPLNQSNAPQLIREVEALSQMRHENIVGYDCCAVQDEYFFIICEYMSAGTLGKLIQSLTTIPERAVRKYARDVLFGLCYLHQRSWVHCDIKPDNILMQSDGTCKLADFGAASLSRSFANAMTIQGTARFSAPEAILGVCSKAGDVYSFGITLAQMVMGVHPWHAYPESDAFFAVRYLGEIRHAQETGTPCAMQPDLPTNLEDKELETVIHRCCEFDSKNRPTVEELLTMLS
ncbi:mitogen-activated protein kinase-like protein [Leptomonas seymouri]|uniref:Mitogen-activated protein kinase-like protein n=1 Tax=Leptomonas seymouri TaxID=5684 RepID=A0A0N0P883_LEPSE|nr:mitogen-activated protein kinase-like protein [Leptomonas seymouri]|eukprot:KPI89217.1 mitogen-activated protein kinase-like protein [Leptomonas seymouri]